MCFDDVLNDIESLLVGKKLNSINPNTPSLFITQIDKNNDKYYVSNDEEKKGTKRSISELRDIWNDLTRKGFSNVDQSLYGSGTSRNQPETILANLPYIQFFRYKKKKHILLRNHNTHEPATLSEVQGSDFRTLRKQLDGYFNINVKEVAQTQRSLLSSIKNAFDSVLTKYPGESSIQDTEFLLQKLEKIQVGFEEGIVSLDNETINENDFDDNDTDGGEYKSFDEQINSPEYKGFDAPEENDVVDENELSENKIDPKSSSKTIIRQLTPVLSLIYDRLSYGDIELQPDFQRKDRIWKDDKKSKLIESILMRLPLPVFYFAEKPNGSWVVVDGLQRITTVYDYMRGEFPLKKLKVLEKYDDKYFKDLTRTEQRDIREYAITVHLIDMQSDTSNMVVELFHRINTYGVNLSNQEIRSALNQGSSVKFLRYIASLEVFKKATHHKIKADRQMDMELCLSGLAFTVLGYQYFEQQSYGDFLSSAMNVLNKKTLTLINDEKIDKGLATIDSSSLFYTNLAKMYSRGLDIAFRVFGGHCFVKDPSTGKKTISKPLYELIVTYFSQLTELQEDELLSNSSVFIDTLYCAIKNDEIIYATWGSDVYKEAKRGFMYSISTSTGKKVTVNYRFEAFGEILKQSTGIDVDLKPILRINK